MNFGAHFATICLATLPEDCQAMAAKPRHAASSNAVKARTADLPIDPRSPGTWTLLTAAARNVPTGGTAMPAEKSDPNVGLRIRRIAHGVGRQAGKLCIRGRDQNDIGRDHKEIVRIIGLFRVHSRAPSVL